MGLFLPESDLTVPELLHPYRKPIGNRKLDFTDEFARNATNVYLFNSLSTFPGRNLVDGHPLDMVLDSAGAGTGEYTYSQFDGNMCLYAESGVDHYLKSRNPIGVIDGTSKFFYAIIFTPLAPTVGYEHTLSFGTMNQDTSPSMAWYSVNEIEQRIYLNGSYQESTPLNVGKRQIIAHSYNGMGLHRIYTSTNNSVEYLEEHNSGGSASEHLIIGTGMPLLVAKYEMIYFSYGWAPSDPEMDKLIENPYRFLGSL